MLITIGNFLFKWRDKVFPLLMLPLVIIAPAQGMVFGVNESTLDIVGILFMICGEALRIAVVGLKYIKRGGVDKKVYADDLVTEGLFTVCRNPLYVGNILIATGALLIHAQPVLLIAGTALILFIYVAIVSTEENFLRGKFGAQFEAYCRDTNRWLPNPARLPAAFGSVSFNFNRVLVKEYSTIAGLAAAITILLTREQIQATGHIVLSTWVATGAILCFVLMVRTMKKSGRLSG